MPVINTSDMALVALRLGEFIRAVEQERSEISCNCSDCRRSHVGNLRDIAEQFIAQLVPIATEGRYSDSLMREALSLCTTGDRSLSANIREWINSVCCTSGILAQVSDEYRDTALAEALADAVMPREDYDDDTSDDYDADSDGGLYAYSTDVLRIHNEPRPDKELVFGVELEMEVQNVSRTLTAVGGPRGDEFICKSDGSLDNGVELVTLPRTLDYHRDKFGWAEILAKALRSGAKSGNTRTCGIHVHANKAALSPLQIGKMLVLLNARENAQFVETVAQRSGSRFAQRKSKTITDGKYPSEDRYEILNVGPRTVEFRLFKGNLRLERVLKNLEFCHAVITYCATASMQELDSLHFGNWLRKNRGQYPNLIRFLAEARLPRFDGMFNAKKGADAPVLEDA